MPYEFSRVRSANSDENQALLDKIALSVFRDMKIISESDYNDVAGNPSAQIDLLTSVPDLSGNRAIEFSERYIDAIMQTDENLLYSVPPSTLAKSYVKIKERLAETDINSETREKLTRYQERIAERIDSLIGDFAIKIGYSFVDTTNIADVYSGYKEMFDAREPDVPENSSLRNQINSNRTVLDVSIREYDDVYNLTGITNENAEEKSQELESNYDNAWNRLSSINVSQDTLDKALTYKFLDKDGKEKTQIDQESKQLLENSELSNILDLARMDMAQKYAVDGDVDSKADEVLQEELDNGLLFKLFEIDTAEKIVNKAIEDPERFTNQENFKKFVEGLSANGSSISQNGYEAAMDAQVNKTAGFASRVKQKLGKFASNATGFFKKVFKPIENIDKRAKDRFATSDNSTKREKRIEFFKRMLQGFGSAFLVSATLTTIATAAAAVAGISVAASLAVVGTVAAIGVSAFQIKKWRDTQKLNGKPADIKALLADKRMMATLGTTAIAAIAMCFGAAGFTQAAAALGYGALALGGGANAVQTYRDAKNLGMSRSESIGWALANVAAVIGGGFAGRATAGAIIDSINSNNPDNRIFQTEETKTRTETRYETRTESHQVYTQDALDNAERIAKMWYADNPGELQHRVDMVNQYNAQNGTNIDPYRAIMLSADAGGQTFDNMALHVDGGGHTHSGGSHTVLTEQWASEHGVSMSDIDALRHMFDGNQIPQDAMDAAMQIDGMVSSINEVGVTSGSAAHYDGVLPQNTVDANGTPVFDTYADGNSAFETKTETIITPYQVEVSETVLNPLESNGQMGMFGIRNEKVTQELKDMAGAFADKIHKKQSKQPEPQPDPQPEPQPEQKQLPGVPGVAGLLPEYVPEEPIENTEQKQIEGGKQPLLLEEAQIKDVDHEEIKEPKYLRISNAMANDLWKLEHHIEDLTKARQSKNLSQKQSEKLWRQLKTAKQTMQTLLNKLGRPDLDTRYNAMYWAWRKEDLKEAETELAALRNKQLHYNDSTTKGTKSEDAYKIAALEAKIAEYKKEIPDDSMFYDPLHVQRDPETAEYVEHEILKEKKKRKFNNEHAEDVDFTEMVSESDEEQNQEQPVEAQEVETKPVETATVSDDKDVVESSVDKGSKKRDNRVYNFKNGELEVKKKVNKNTGKTYDVYVKRSKGERS